MIRTILHLTESFLVWEQKMMMMKNQETLEEGGELVVDRQK